MFQLIMLVALFFIIIVTILFIRSRIIDPERKKYDSWVNHNDDIDDL